MSSTKNIVTCPLTGNCDCLRKLTGKLKRGGQKVVWLIRWSYCQGGHIPRFHPRPKLSVASAYWMYTDSVHWVHWWHTRQTLPLWIRFYMSHYFTIIRHHSTKYHEKPSKLISRFFVKVHEQWWLQSVNSHHIWRKFAKVRWSIH